MIDMHAAGIIAAAAAVTMLLRFLPFIVFGRGTKTPAYINYLSGVLPCAVMGMLIVYCLKNVSLVSYPHGLPELIAGGIVAGLHIWKRNTLLSIAAGTVCYMLLVQLVF